MIKLEHIFFYCFCVEKCENLTRKIIIESYNQPGCRNDQRVSVITVWDNAGMWVMQSAL